MCAVQSTIYKQTLVFLDLTFDHINNCLCYLELVRIINHTKNENSYTDMQETLLLYNIICKGIIGDDKECKTCYYVSSHYI